ncbi:hypothetical protein HKX48_001318 [Thoreauomyces humboldtii]|nr:hypothetical protein HKX48_001318 [Thoreauomyces humboldtii]
MFSSAPPSPPALTCSTILAASSPIGETTPLLAASPSRAAPSCAAASTQTPPRRHSSTSTCSSHSSHSSRHQPPLPPPSPRGHCWCCWETTETSRSGPLIRACVHCRDKDLQYVHQTCIDSYINALPAPIPTTVVPSSPLDDEESAQRPLLSAPDSRYMCTRCTDPYNVVQQPIHPLRVLVKDPLLVAALFLMTPCVLTVLASCVMLLMDAANGLPTDRLIHWPRLHLTISSVDFSLAILAFCVAIYALTWKIVLDACRGKSVKRVVGVDEEADVAVQIDEILTDADRLERGLLSPSSFPATASASEP